MANGNEVATMNQKAVSLRSMLYDDRVKKQLEMALPKWLSADRLLRIVFSATVRNPTLLECTQESILQSVMMCAQLGLEPILGRAYLVPYRNSKNIGGRWVKVYECQFQPGYQGLIDLARRTGVISDVYGRIVYSNDEFDVQFGTERKIVHRPTLTGDPGAPIGAYAIWNMKDGAQHPEFMTIYEINKRRDRSQAYQYAMSNPDNKKAQECPWIQWPDEMALKTVIKFSSKLVPASIEFMEAVSVDDAAEIGARYVSPFSAALDAPPEKTAGDLAAEFDHLAEIEFGRDPAKLMVFNEWMSRTAQANGMSVQVAKAEVIRSSDFEGCVGAFRAKLSAPVRTAANPAADATANPAAQSGPAARPDAGGGRSETGGARSDPGDPSLRKSSPQVDRDPGSAGGNRGDTQRGNRGDKQTGGGGEAVGGAAGNRDAESNQGGSDSRTESGDLPNGGNRGDTQVEFGPGHPFFRDKWIRMKQGTRENKSGLWAYVDEYHAAISDMPMKAFVELSDKFQALYGRSFPYDPDGGYIGGPFGADDDPGGSGDETGGSGDETGGSGDGAGDSGGDDEGAIVDPGDPGAWADSDPGADLAQGVEDGFGGPVPGDDMAGGSDVQSAGAGRDPGRESARGGSGDAGRGPVGGVGPGQMSRLTALQRSYPAAYAQVVGGRVPATVDELDAMVSKVQDVADFTGERF